MQTGIEHVRSDTARYTAAVGEDVVEYLDLHPFMSCISFGRVIGEFVPDELQYSASEFRHYVAKFAFPEAVKKISPYDVVRAALEKKSDAGVKSAIRFDGKSYAIYDKFVLYTDPDRLYKHIRDNATTKIRKVEWHFSARNFDL